MLRLPLGVGVLGSIDHDGEEVFYAVLAAAGAAARAG